MTKDIVIENGNIDNEFQGLLDNKICFSITSESSIQTIESGHNYIKIIKKDKKPFYIKCRGYSTVKNSKFEYWKFNIFDDKEKEFEEFLNILENKINNWGIKLHRCKYSYEKIKNEIEK